MRCEIAAPLLSVQMPGHLSREGSVAAAEVICGEGLGAAKTRRTIFSSGHIPGQFGLQRRRLQRWIWVETKETIRPHPRPLSRLRARGEVGKSLFRLAEQGLNLGGLRRAGRDLT